MAAASRLQLTQAFRQRLQLDEDSVSEQIWPAIDAASSKEQVLETVGILMGDALSPDDPALQEFLKHKFPASRQGSSKSAPVSPPTKSAPSLKKKTAVPGLPLSSSRSSSSTGKSRKAAAWGTPGNARSTPGNARSTPGTAWNSPDPAQSTSDSAWDSPLNVAQEPQAPQDHTKIEFSAQFKDDLASLDERLRLFTRRKVPAMCFCGTSRHTLAPYSPQCKSCGLVLCIINRPIDPCPSCGETVLPDAVSVRVSLETQRSDMISNEQSRIEKEHEELFKQRLANPFPDFNDASIVQVKGGTGSSYSGKLGGKPSSGGVFRLDVSKAKTGKPTKMYRQSKAEKTKASHDVHVEHDSPQFPLDTQPETITDALVDENDDGIRDAK